MKVALELQPMVYENRSGVGLYTYELARRLSAQGEMEFCGNLFNFLGRHDFQQPLEGLTMPVQENRWLPYRLYRILCNALPLSYDWVFPKAELSLFLNYIIPPYVPGKVATVIYDMTYLRFPETMEGKNRERIQKDIAYSVARSSRILTISEFSKREIQELLQVPPGKISVIPCAPTTPLPPMSFTETARKFGIKTPYVLYVGTIEPRKNLTRLIRAFERLKQTVHLPHALVLAGGSGWKNEAIYQIARIVSCREEICFTGYLSEEEKSTLYQNADVFVFPSLYEGFGMPPLEAMQADCPVVCSDVASLPEIVGDAAHLVEPLVEDSIAEGIWKVLSDRAYADSLRARGRMQVKHYTWEESAKRLMAVCKEILEEP